MIRKLRLLTALAVLLGVTQARPAQASTLTLTDTFGGSNTVWTLDIQTGCVTCNVTLKADFQDPAGPATNAYTGEFLDAIQWSIDNPNVTPTTVGFNGTTAGTTADWTFSFANLNANQCGGGSAQSVCGAWSGGGAAGGFGPIVNGSTLQWTFASTFASALPADLVSGNIRAAFNTSNGQNFNIFSPGGGSFTGGGGSGQDFPVPEPASLLLLGSGLLGAAVKARRSK